MRFHPFLFFGILINTKCFSFATLRRTGTQPVTKKATKTKVVSDKR